MIILDEARRRRGNTNLNPSGASVVTATVLNSSATPFVISDLVVASSGYGFKVVTTALDSDGNPFTLFT